MTLNKTGFLEANNLETRWLKFKNIKDLHCLGCMDIAVFGEGCHIVFFDLKSSKKNVHRVNTSRRGDGVQCIACHWELPIFAFAEKCLHPRIFVYHYPSLLLISSIEVVYLMDVFDSVAKSPNGYLQLAFIEMELMVSLETYPDFTIRVWRWRNGEELISCASGVISLQQHLRCSYSAPSYISQVPHKTEMLYIWEIHHCYHNHFLEKHQVWLPMECTLSDFSWTPWGDLLVVDQKATVYSVDFEGWELFEEYNWNGNKVKYAPCITWYSSGFLLADPSGTVMYLQGRAEWKVKWVMQPQEAFIMMVVAVPSNAFYGIDADGWLCSLTREDIPSVVKLGHFQYNISYFDFVYPEGHVFATVDDGQCLALWDLENGHKVGEYTLCQNALCLVSNPLDPYLALGREDGTVDFVNCFDPHSPKLLCQLVMSEYEITDMKFTSSGQHLIAVSSNLGHLFLIQCTPGDRMTICSHRAMGCSVVDIAAVENDPFIVMYVLTRTSSCCSSGNKLHIFLSMYNTSEISLQSIIITDTLYKNILTTTLGPYMLCCVPHRSRTIHHIFIQKPVLKKQMYRIDSLIIYPSGHELRNYHVDLCCNYIITYGRDGLIFVRKLGSLMQQCLAIPHHRRNLGIKKALLDPLSNVIVSLGYDGNLVCTVVREAQGTNRKPQFTSMMALHEMSSTFQAKETSGFVPSGDGPPNWLKLQEEIEEVENKMLHAEQRKYVLDRFLNVNRKIEELLEENMKCAPEEQLPISSFDINLKYREKLCMEFQHKMEEWKEELIFAIKAQDALRQKILEKTWHKMDVKVRFIQSIYGFQKVSSYPFPPVDEENEEKIRKILHFKEIMLKVSEEETFHPWEQYHGRTFKKYEQNEYTPSFSPPIKHTVVNANKYQREHTGPTTFFGSFTYKYIEPPEIQSSQFEIGTFHQIEQEICIQKTITNKLRHFFNEIFDQMAKEKKHDMNLVLQKTARLSYLLHELKDTQTPIDNPQWGQWEDMDKMLTIQPHEVSASPYVSLSEEDLHDKLVADDGESQRLAEILDPFRVEALDMMMDGVLELHWEDRIKKDIPLPKCMQEKLPEDWNEEDLRAVKEYEKKVEVLKGERERYRTLCEAEYVQLKEELIEVIQRFESHLKELCYLKAEIETCIGQENLKILRSVLKCHERIALEMEEKKMETLLLTHEQKIKEKEETLLFIEELVNKCRTDFEELLEEDQNLEKEFKNEFPRLPPYVIDQLYKIFRRRPRMHTKVQSSVTLLNELLQALKNQHNPVYMAKECSDYVKALDSLDYQHGCPASVDLSCWEHLCCLRRTKILSEIQIKSAALTLAETEATYQLHIKRLAEEKERHNEMIAELKAIQQDIIDAVVDVQFQMLVKQRIVEILDENGSIQDFSDGILIHRRQVECLNAKIIERGMEKISAIETVIKFHSTILGVEWEHKKLRMTYEDLQENLYRLNEVKLTKELQRFLHVRAMGFPDSHGILSPEQQIMLITRDCENRLSLLNSSLKKLTEQYSECQKDSKMLEHKIKCITAEIDEIETKIDHRYAEEESQKRDINMRLLSKKGFLQLDVQAARETTIYLQAKLELLRQKLYPTLKFSQQ